MTSSKEIWKVLGIATVRIVDQVYLGGSLTFLYETGKRVGEKVLEILSRDDGLDWKLSYSEFYREETPRLLRINHGDEEAVLPQTALFVPGPNFNDEVVKLEIESTDFVARTKVPEVLKIHQQRAGEKIFFNGHNARLLSADDSVFRFQGCRYFDYLSTNLALDYPLAIGGTLRNQIHRSGALEPLPNSILANSTGINGLVFSREGKMIIQHRRDVVIVRPGEICPGFSGTVDKVDVTNAILGGSRLTDLDAPREMVEELGVERDAISSIRFLGITRELIRGGAPEMFYAVDVDLPAEEILNSFPRDREGDPIAIPFGILGRTIHTQPFPRVGQFDLLDALVKLSNCVHGKLSVPLFTNIVLWQRLNAPYVH